MPDPTEPATTTTDTAAPADTSAPATPTAIDTPAAPAAPTAPAAPKVEPKWPDDWRERYAKGPDGKVDEKKLQRLSRFATPDAAFDAYVAAQNKISEAGLKSPFPDKGTPDEQMAWRRDNGIPEAPDKYDLTFEDGLVVGEEDKPVIDDFLKAAHENHLNMNQAKSAVKWYYQLQEKQAEERTNKDREIAQQVQDNLHAEWGNEYRPNINRIHALLDTAPPGVKDKILNSRFSDGTPIASDPDTLKFFIDLAYQLNPATTLVPGAGANVASAIDDEMAKYEKMMGDRTSEYWKGPRAEKIQARYRELTAGKERLTRKAS